MTSARWCSASTSFSYTWARDGGHADGGAAVGRRDAGRDPAPRVDRDRERGAEGRGVRLGLERELQSVASLAGQRQADEPAPEAGHEVDQLRGDLLRRQRE